MTHPLLGAAGVAALAATVMACNGATASSIGPTAPTTTVATTTTTPTTPAPTAPTTPTAPSGSAVQAMYAQFVSTVTVTISGATVTLRTNDLPDHKSPYWGPSSASYEAPHQGMQVNPHRIAPQNLTFTLSSSPAAASSTSDTPLGPIGVSVNGVVFFNQYAAGRQSLTSEVVSFDRYNGHPSPNDQYHYHFEPVSITATSKSRLIGVMLDGFPVYGPQERDGSAPSGLDSCNGHTGVTTEFESGIYHYHATTAVPYLSGCFRGTAGTVR
jgi:YHYH protein